MISLDRTLIGGVGRGWIVRELSTNDPSPSIVFGAWCLEITTKSICEIPPPSGVSPSLPPGSSVPTLIRRTGTVMIRYWPQRFPLWAVESDFLRRATLHQTKGRRWLRGWRIQRVTADEPQLRLARPQNSGERRLESLSSSTYAEYV